MLLIQNLLVAMNIVIIEPIANCRRVNAMNKMVREEISQHLGKILLSLAMLILLSILSLLPGLLTKEAFDEGISKSNFSVVISLSLILITVLIVRSIFGYFSNVIFSKVSQLILLNLKKAISSKIMGYPMDFFNSLESGYVTSRINEINNLSGLFSVNSIKVVLSFFEMIFALLILFNQNIILTLLLFCLAPIYYVISKKFLGQLNMSSLKLTEQNATVNSKMQQTIQGIEEIKNLTVEDEEQSKINNASEHLTELSIKQSVLFSLGTELLSLLGALSTVVLLIFGGLFVIKGSISLGGYMIFMSYLPKLYAPMQMMSSLSLSIQPAIVSYKRLDELFSLFPDDDSNLQTVSKIKKIEIDKLYFKYNDSEKELYNGLTQIIESGDCILVQGPNGSGKSTLIKLMMGLYHPQNGTIKINDTDQSLYTSASIRKRFALVSQKIYLFNATVKENITYGCEPDDSRYSDVVKFLKLENLFFKLPNGENTIVGENGVRLSGGQIQRIAIARALIRNADILAFDEAFSALDFENREIVNDLFRKIINEKICLFISHDEKISKNINFNKVIELG